MWKISAGLVLWLSAMVPAIAQIPASAQSVTYLIPGLGYAKFDAGASAEQAFADVCGDAELFKRFPDIPCTGLLKQTGHGAVSASVGAELPQPDRQEVGSPAKALSAATFGLLIGLVYAGFVYFMVRGKTPATYARRYSAFVTALCVWYAGSYLMNAVLGGISFDEAVGRVVGALAGAIVFGVAAYAVGKARDKRITNQPPAKPTIAPVVAASSTSEVSRVPPTVVRAAKSVPPAETILASSIDPYAVAGKEVLSGDVDAALWARALVEGEGVDGPVRAAYVRARVEQLTLEEARRVEADELLKSAQHHELRSYADRNTVSLEEASIMMPLGIMFKDGRYVVYDADESTAYRYDSLRDAQAYAQMVIQRRAGK